MFNESQNSDENSIRIRRGKVDSLSVYEITDYELDALIKGSPDALYLNFAIFLVSVATSFLISLLTTKIESERVFIVFVLVTIVGFAIGFILLILWWRSRSQVEDLIKKIKDRIPQDEIIKE